MVTLKLTPDEAVDLQYALDITHLRATYRASTAEGTKTHERDMAWKQAIERLQKLLNQAIGL